MEILANKQSDYASYPLHVEWSAAMQELQRAATVVQATETAAPSISVRQLVRLSSDPEKSGDQCGRDCKWTALAGQNRKCLPENNF